MFQSGVIWTNSIRYTRKDSIKAFVTEGESYQMTESQLKKSWKECRRYGVRCAKVNITFEEVK